MSKFMQNLGYYIFCFITTLDYTAIKLNLHLITFLPFFMAVGDVKIDLGLGHC